MCRHVYPETIHDAHVGQGDATVPVSACHECEIRCVIQGRSVRVPDDRAGGGEDRIVRILHVMKEQLVECLLSGITLAVASQPVVCRDRRHVVAFRHHIAVSVDNANDVGIEVNVVTLAIGFVGGVGQTNPQPRGQRLVRVYGRPLPVVREVLVVADVVHHAAGDLLGVVLKSGLVRIGVVRNVIRSRCALDELMPPAAEGGLRQALVDARLQNVADNVVAIRGGDHDRQLHRHLGAGFDLVEGDLLQTERQPLGHRVTIVVVQDCHEPRVVGVGAQTPGCRIGGRPRDIDLVRLIGNTGYCQVCNLVIPQAGAEGTVRVVGVEQIATCPAAATDHNQHQKCQHGASEQAVFPRHSEPPRAAVHGTAFRPLFSKGSAFAHHCQPNRPPMDNETSQSAAKHLYRTHRTTSQMPVIGPTGITREELPKPVRRVGHRDRWGPEAGPRRRSGRRWVG